MKSILNVIGGLTSVLFVVLLFSANFYGVYQASKYGFGKFMAALVFPPYAIYVADKALGEKITSHQNQKILADISRWNPQDWNNAVNINIALDEREKGVEITNRNLGKEFNKTDVINLKLDYESSSKHAHLVTEHVLNLVCPDIVEPWDKYFVPSVTLMTEGLQESDNEKILNAHNLDEKWMDWYSANYLKMRIPRHPPPYN